MKRSLWLLVLVVALVGGALAGFVVGSTLSSREGSIAEGVLFSVHYEIGENRSGGFTRANSAEAVPGGNGSWNVNAYGKLYRDFLVVNYPDQKDLDVEVIPCSRLINIQFGDGGIKKVESG